MWLAIASLVLPLLLVGGPAPAQTPSHLSTLEYQDLRLARLAETMLRANRRLCNRLMPLTGLVLHTRDQYSGAVGEAFANGNVAIAAIVPGSAADRASLSPGDGISEINAIRLDDLPAPDEGPMRDAVFQVLAEQDTGSPVTLAIARGGIVSEVVLQAQPGCRALVEILSSEGKVARSDGRVIQLSYGLASQLTDESLAAVFAHEMAHLVLEHRRRLAEAGINKGLLAEFGRNQRSNRQAEVEADRLSVHLLANAGLDPQIAPRFWLSKEGRRVDAGLLRSAIYPSPSARAELMRQEIAEYLPSGTGPSYPEHLLALREMEF